MHLMHECTLKHFEKPAHFSTRFNSKNVLFVTKTLTAGICLRTCTHENVINIPAWSLLKLYSIATNIGDNQNLFKPTSIYGN